MSNRKKDTINELLDNDLFLRWILHPTPELNQYWIELMKKEPEIKEDILLLSKIIKSIGIKEEELTPEENTELWKNIEKQTSRTLWHSGKHLWLKVASVAALLAIVTTFTYLHIGRDKQINYSSIIAPVDSADSNVLLIVSEKEIQLQENNVELIYDKDGSLIINSQQIAANNTEEVQLNQLIVPYGKSSNIFLSDGTKIWVNSGSRVIYPSVFAKDHREIYVEGEIYLEVARNENQPFIVKTNMLDINVLGTSFNVQAYKGETNQSIVLVTGSVSIKNNQEKKETKISPNQLYSYEKDQKKIVVKEVDIYDYICWKYGFIHFKSENLTTVLSRLEKYYNIQINYDEDAIRNIRVSGKLDLKESLDDVFKTISLTAPIKYTIENNQIMVKITK